MHIYVYDCMYIYIYIYVLIHMQKYSCTAVYVHEGLYMSACVCM